MTKLFRALKAEQRKLWSKGSVLGCFVAMFLLSFALSFFCSIVRDSGSSAAELFITEHAYAAFEEYDKQTSWVDKAEEIIRQSEEGISQTAVKLTNAAGSERVILERQMAQLVREKAIAQYRLDNSLPIRDWSGCYALILCLWIMTPVAGVLAAVYASDMFAGEFSRGTIRMIVSRPATRIKIYIAKLISSLTLGWLLLGVAYAAAGIGCGVLMSPADGAYVGYINGSVYSTSWSSHVFSVFLCCCGMIAVVVALCAALGNCTRSRGVSAAGAVTLALTGMVSGHLSGLIDWGIIGLLLPFCYDITVPLCGVAYNSDTSFLFSTISLAAHFIAFVCAGYAGMKRDV